MLYDKVLDVRKTFEGVIGEGESSKLVGLDAGLSKVASPVLRRYARRALGKLEVPDFKPSPKVPGAKLEPQETADDLRPALTGFEATLKQLARQRRLTQEAQRVRQEALDRLHFVTFNGSRMFQSSYTIAGERFHAERIRQSLGRSSARRTSPEGDAAAVDAAAVGAAAADAPAVAETSAETSAPAAAEAPSVPLDPSEETPQPASPSDEAAASLGESRRIVISIRRPALADVARGPAVFFA